MPNEFRKHGSAGGRVGYPIRAEKGKFDLEKESGVKRAKKLPASAATRQKPLPTFQKGTKPMQPKPMNTAPHGTKAVKAKYAQATDEEY